MDLPHIRPVTEADISLVLRWLPVGDPGKDHDRITRKDEGKVLDLSA